MTDKKPTAELKCCPCGKGAHVGSASRLDGLLEAYVECDDCCGFRVHLNRFYDRHKHTAAEMYRLGQSLIDEAIKAWNNQPDKDRLAELEAELTGAKEMLKWYRDLIPDEVYLKALQHKDTNNA